MSASCKSSPSRLDARRRGDHSGSVEVDVLGEDNVGVPSHLAGGAAANIGEMRRLSPLLHRRHRTCRMRIMCLGLPRRRCRHRSCRCLPSLRLPRRRCQSTWIVEPHSATVGRLANRRRPKGPGCERNDGHFARNVELETRKIVRRNR